MAKFKIVKLFFTSPLHIGKGIGSAYDTAENTLHSDTISGAIASAFCIKYPKENLLDFMHKYKVSSGFPFYHNVCFLPRPLLNIHVSIDGVDEYNQKKKLKKVDYVETSVWVKLITGLSVDIPKNYLSANGKFLFNKPAENIIPFKDQLQQRVMVPRNGGDAVPYFVDRRFFSPKSGLYFFLDSDAELEQKIMVLLEYLGTTGFGTDKSVGNGQFESVLSELELNLPENSDRCMLISLWCPEKKELTDDFLGQSSYNITQRGGFIAGTSNNHFRHLRKKSVYMFTEGSILKKPSASGKIENVRPLWDDEDLHPVYRDGRAFCLPVNI